MQADDALMPQARAMQKVHESAARLTQALVKRMAKVPDIGVYDTTLPPALPNGPDAPAADATNAARNAP